MAIMNRFDRIDDYRKKEDMQFKLYNKLRENLREVEESFNIFRLSIKEHLCI